MRRAATYLALLIVATSVRAQNCEQNMLTIPEGAGYGKAQKGFLDLKGAFTIEFWVRLSANSPNAGLIEQHKAGDSGTYSIRLTQSNEVMGSFAFASGRESVTSQPIASPTDWNHVAITFTVNDSLRLYINGALAASKKTNALGLRPSTGDSLYAGYSKLTGAALIGSLDEVGIWSVARTQSEIQSSRYTGLIGNEAGLAAYWRFDDAAGSRFFHDFTGKGLDGIVIGSAFIEENATLAIMPKHPGYMLDAIEDEIVMRDVFCSLRSDTIVHIRNIGPDTVDIGGIGFVPGGSIFSVSSSGFPIPPNSASRAIISIQADPLYPGDFTDTLVIAARNTCGGSVRIPVRIHIDSVGIAFNETSVILPKPYLPCLMPFEREVTLRNSGTREVTVSGAQFATNVGISLADVSFPFALPAGKSVKLKLRYDQGNDGKFIDTLIVMTTECQRKALLPLSFIRSSIAYDLSAFAINLPLQRNPPVTVDTAITIYNIGTSDIFISDFSVFGKGFGRHPDQKKSSAYLYPGDSARVRIRFESKGECGVFQGQLVLNTPPPCPLTITIPLSVTVNGPEVVALEPIYNIGATCQPGKDTITIGIVNRSGTPVKFSETSFLRQTFSFALPPPLSKFLPDGDTLSIKVRFTPKTPGRHSDTLRLYINLCGYVDIPLEGYWGVGEVALSDTSVEFGHSCDSSEERRKMTIRNTTGKAFSITNVTQTGSDALTFITPLTLFISPGDSQELEFRFKQNAFGKFETTFLFTSVGDCYVAAITARGVRERSALNWDADTLHFGEQCPGTKKQRVATLRNPGFGNYLITSIGVDNLKYFTVPDLRGWNIAPGSFLELPIDFLPDSVGPFGATLTIVFAPCRDTVRLAIIGAGGPKPELVVSDTLLVFGNVRLYDSAMLCIQLENPSCIPLTLSPGDIIISPIGSDFTIRNDLQLPREITRDAPLKVCFSFKPSIEQEVTSSVMLNTNGKLQQVLLRGKGVRPNLKFEPPLIDFGDVEINDTAMRLFIIRNAGSDSAHLQFTLPGAPYALRNTLPDVIMPGEADTLMFDFIPTEQKLFVGKVTVDLSDGKDSTIYLLGRGVKPGLLFSYSNGVDFGDVRIQRDSEISISIKGSPKAEYPIAIESVTIVGGDNKFSKLSGPATDTLYSESEVQTYRIRYAPDYERQDFAKLIVTHDKQSDALDLRGRGVEAHLRIGESLIDFDTVVIGETLQRTFQIYNDGGYPMDIVDTVVQFYPAVFIKGTIDTVPIPPYSSATVTAFFTPSVAQLYQDELIVGADAPERRAGIRLQGKGSYAQGTPDIFYKVEDASLRVGDIIELPIYVGGADAAKVVADSIYLRLKYDPTVAYVYDTVITAGAITSGMRTGIEYHYEDSAIEVRCVGKPAQLREGVLLKLKVEALLGPLDSTTFTVTDASPRNLGDPILNSGFFYVTDCGNYRTNILFKGPYSISAPKPNPASDRVTLVYELGLDGPVKVDLVDALGRKVKTIVDRFERHGAHQAVFSVEGLASGSYYYVITSLEYRGFGKLLISE